jgi:hypothetical protein
MKKKNLKKRLNKLWKATKKDLNAFLQKASDLIKKGEEHLKDGSKKGHEKVQSITLNLEREKLYHQLGKMVGGYPKPPGYAKKKLALLNKIKKVNRKIKQLKKK